MTGPRSSNGDFPPLVYVPDGSARDGFVWPVVEQWVALPNGVSADRTRLRLTVFRTVRLYGPGGIPLSGYPTAVNWPSSMPDSPVTVQFLSADTTVTASAAAQRVSAPPDPALWQKLLGVALVE